MNTIVFYSSSLQTVNFDNIASLQRIPSSQVRRLDIDCRTRVRQRNLKCGRKKLGLSSFILSIRSNNFPRHAYSPASMVRWLHGACPAVVL